MTLFLSSSIDGRWPTALKPFLCHVWWAVALKRIGLKAFYITGLTGTPIRNRERVMLLWHIDTFLWSDMKHIHIPNGVDN